MTLARSLLLIAILAAPLLAAQDETRTETFDWGTVTIPAQATVGQEIAVVVSFTPQALAADGVLAVHLPWWDASDRREIMSHAKTTVTAGATGPFILKLPIKARDGLTKVAATVFVAPDGSYRSRVLGTEVGPIVIR